MGFTPLLRPSLRGEPGHDQPRVDGAVDGLQGGGQPAALRRGAGCSHGGGGGGGSLAMLWGLLRGTSGDPPSTHPTRKHPSKNRTLGGIS